MAAKRTIPEESLPELKAARKAVRTADELRRLLCLWLPTLGLGVRLVARALGMSQRGVADVRRARRPASSGARPAAT